MKYYYDGKLIRTSNHEYHFALFADGMLICCSKTENGCKARMRSEISFTERLIKGHEKNNRIDDLEACKKWLNAKWEVVKIESMA